MCLLDQSGVTGGGLDPYNHYNTCFVCKHPQHVNGKIWKSTIVLLNLFSHNILFVISAHRGNITGPFSDLSWTQARDYCEQQGLKLLTIDSQEEEDYVSGTINPTSR